ncbi:MAG: carbonic anhydrase [Thermodesulfobacteriota bacterium]
MKLIRIVLVMTVVYVMSSMTEAAGAAAASVQKPSPDQIIQILTEGNARFAGNQPRHPHTDAERLNQAGQENQGDHALATVISCSDSRVPVERIFDVGVMDVFVVRVAGNVCNTDEIGTIEYGLAHVHTPLLVVMGHTQCGAVTAATQAVQGHGHPLERNIPPLIRPIIPAVKRTISENPNLQGDELVAKAIIENVWQAMEDLFLKSPAVRDMVKSGQAKVVGAVYDVGTGQVAWLPQDKPAEILAKAEADPARAKEAMASSEPGEKEKGAVAPTPPPIPDLSGLDKGIKTLQVSLQEMEKRLDSRVEALNRGLLSAIQEKKPGREEEAAKDLTKALQDRDRKIEDKVSAVGQDVTKSINELHNRLDRKVESLRDGLVLFAWIGGLGVLALMVLLLWLILVRTRGLALQHEELRSKTRSALGSLKKEIQQSRRQND